MPPRSCPCGGKYEEGRCQRNDCPRIHLGQGSWQVALTRLQDLHISGKLTALYPQMDLDGLRSHIEETELEYEKRQYHRARKGTPDRGRRHDHEVQIDKKKERGRSEGSQRVWRKPRQPDSLPPSTTRPSSATPPDEIDSEVQPEVITHNGLTQAASPIREPHRPSGRFAILADGLTMMQADYDEDHRSRSSGYPLPGLHAEPPAVPLKRSPPNERSPQPPGFKAPPPERLDPNFEALQPEDMDLPTTDEDSEGGYSSGVTLDSDGSQASAFGLRSALHEIEDDDELSEASSQDEDNRAVASRDRVKAWRTQNSLQNNLDFTGVFISFEEAYSHAGRAVGEAWSKAMLLAYPEADISAIKATATKVRKVDGDRNRKAIDKKGSAESPLLRQPGEDTKPKDTEQSKLRFIKPLTQLMMDCGVGYSDSPATMADIMTSLEHKATQIAKAHDVPILYGAVSTASELKEYLESRSHRGVVNIEPLVLEEFLHQSTSQIRVLNSLTWMCKNLQLGWPIDEIRQPDVDKLPADITECKRSPRAQPGILRALEDAIEAAATSGEPTWLAPLASWLQTMSNLRLDQLLRRSVPVEQYDEWMLFFCKQGKRKHDRSGFYWGVPSKTSTGYDWAAKFLDEYNRRRIGDSGREMMGMIFHTETHGYFSSRAVNDLTVKAVAGALSDPTALTTSTWKMMLPAAALHLNFSTADQLVISDLRDNEARGDEVPITPKYKGRGDKSRMCKLVCAEVLAALTKLNAQTFEEIPADHWEQLAGEARAKVKAQQPQKSLWRNPDIAEPAGGGCKVKKSQTTFPSQLKGILLSPSNRLGQRYCADFQSGECQAGDTCQMGLHKCAALLKGGRTCQGNHAGSACKFTKRHALFRKTVPAAPQQAACSPQPRTSPAAKLVPPEVIQKAIPKQPPPILPSQQEIMLDTQGANDQKGAEETFVEDPAATPKIKAQPAPNWVSDDSIMREILPRLQDERAKVRGIRIRPEPPRLVAKVCREEGRGELWLGAVPTTTTMGKISEIRPSIQIYCFHAEPTQVQVDWGVSGMYIPRATTFRCEMSHPRLRQAEMRALMPILVNSLRQGDNAYVHCVSGLSRAPMAATVMCAVLMGISIEEAKDIINQTRNVDFWGARRMQGPWMNQILREHWTNAESPTGFSREASEQPCWMYTTVHATIMTDVGAGPICRHNGKSTGILIATVETLEQASKQFGGNFCPYCHALLRASLKSEVQRLWSWTK